MIFKRCPNCDNTFPVFYDVFCVCKTKLLLRQEHITKPELDSDWIILLLSQGERGRSDIQRAFSYKFNARALDVLIDACKEANEVMQRDLYGKAYFKLTEKGKQRAILLMSLLPKRLKSAEEIWTENPG